MRPEPVEGHHRRWRCALSLSKGNAGPGSTRPRSSTPRSGTTGTPARRRSGAAIPIPNWWPRPPVWSPTTALDVGCGEGADAVWLAERGWQVTALDISQVALDRAAEHARQSAPEAAERITWQQADLTEGLARSGRRSASSRCSSCTCRRASAIRCISSSRSWWLPGGTLLIVGHDPSDLETAGHLRAHRPGSAVHRRRNRRSAGSGGVDRRGDSRGRSVVDPDGRTGRRWPMPWWSLGAARVEQR